MPVHARKVRRSTHLSSPSSVAWRSASWIVCWRLARRRRLALAFAVGTQARTARQAAVVGTVCLPAAHTGYCYSYMHLAEHQAGPYHLVHAAGRWLPGELVTGAVFGILGGGETARESGSRRISVSSSWQRRNACEPFCIRPAKVTSAAGPAW